jgi:Fe-S-cluster containining protein
MLDRDRAIRCRDSMGMASESAIILGVVIDEMVGTRWYVGGLHFGCQGCGRCCSGPAEGYIWVVRREIELIAEHLGITPGELRRRYLRRVGLRTTIVEHRVTKDCIFLRQTDAGTRCAIYPVRPSQCRSWPFWPENLYDADAWNQAGTRCPGINQGRGYSCGEIERIGRNSRWWENPSDTAESSPK